MEVFIIVIIGFLQFVLFGVNYTKLQLYKNIFPSTKHLSLNIIDGFVQGIEAKITNPIFKVILSSINKYLANNKGQVSDYHLIKDIVDRNADSKEDEINTLIPIPLYLGLIGTMGCIFVGLKYLNLNSVILGEEKAMIEGISPLLSGVALAMITSIIGIFLTTLGSYIAKNSRTKLEENKNDFLSWMQEKLLPQLSNDTANVLQKMATNLSVFNKTFTENTQGLKSTLGQVNDSYKNQAELFKFIAELRITDIATANIQVYEKLKNCTNEIGKLGDYLNGVGNYSQDLQQVVIEIQQYFNTELDQLTQRNTLFAETLNKIDSNSKEALDDFNKHFSTSLQKMQETFEHKISDIGDTLALQQETLKSALDTQNKTLIQSIDYQQKTFAEKLQDTTKLVDELNKIGDKIASISRLEQAIKEQNGKFNELVRAINELAKVKTTGEFKVIAESPRLPIWKKTVVYGGIGVSILYFLSEIAIKALSFFGITL